VTARLALVPMMSTAEATNAQAVAAIIQAGAAVVFLVSVVSDAIRRAHFREQEGREQFVTACRSLFFTRPGGMTPEEAAGFDSPRPIELIKERLEAHGANFSYPYKLHWWRGVRAWFR
jgi:hypothetical protein